MIERFIYTALNEGIATFQKDPRLLEDMFRDAYGLSKVEYDAILKVFSAKPPNVVHGYAHTDHKFPLYSIVLSNESENVHFIGDDGGIVDAPGTPDHLADIHASIWDHSYDVMVYTEHPDVTLYYYEIAKSILIAANDYFTRQGIFEIHLSGMDMAPDPRYVPEHLFLRKLSFKCQREFQILLYDVPRGFKIRGIHVDSSGSTSDVGGVQTNVVPYVEGEGE